MGGLTRLTQLTASTSEHLETRDRYGVCKGDSASLVPICFSFGANERSPPTDEAWRETSLHEPANRCADSLYHPINLASYLLCDGRSVESRLVTLISTKRHEIVRKLPDFMCVRLHDHQQLLTEVLCACKHVSGSFEPREHMASDYNNLESDMPRTVISSIIAWLKCVPFACIANLALKSQPSISNSRSPDAISSILPVRVYGGQDRSDGDVGDALHAVPIRVVGGDLVRPEKRRLSRLGWTE